jgi:hypothetical protein
MTMDDLFPGNIGRMKLTRVILRLKRPDLRNLPPAQALDPALADLLRKTIKELEAV